MLVVMFVCIFIFTMLLIVHDVMIDKLAWLPYDVVICIISIFGAVQFAEDLVWQDSGVAAGKTVVAPTCFGETHSQVDERIDQSSKRAVPTI